MKLGIYGAGGLGREVYELATICNGLGRRWDDIVFINICDGTPPNMHDRQVIGFENVTGDMELVVAVGEPFVRAQLYDNALSHQIPLATIVHPSVHIPSSTRIGNGTVICAYAFVSCDVTIDDNVYIQPNASIGHDSKIGKHSILSSFSSIAGRCSIGSSTYIGMNTCIKEGTQVGSDTIIGMGSAVFRDIPDHVIALGNPARVVKNNDEHRVFKDR